MVISIDPGESISGVSVIMLNHDGSGKTELIGFNEVNELIVSKIKKYYVKYNPIIVIEDIVPYRHKFSKQIVATCKWIGELVYRLKNELELEIRMVTRGQVKKWVFDAFPALSLDRVDKKIAYLDNYGEKNDKKRYRNKDGGIRKATFHWVDDRIVIAAMKELWQIPTPKPGKSNIYGFSKHSWQALAAGSYFLSLTTPETPKVSL